MADNWILGDRSLNLCYLVTFVLTACLPGQCFSYEVRDGGPYNSFTVSSFLYSLTEVEPFQWRYIRVDLPPWFSSMSLLLESSVDLDPENIKKIPPSQLPIVCLREGGPPLPDVYDISLTALDPASNGSFEDIQGLQNAEQCYPMQANISIKLTNEQISPGSWFVGLFNGIGAMRTQSKMINRGTAYSFAGNVRVEGCKIPTLLGQYCNQTVDLLSCVGSNLKENLSDTKLYGQTAENLASCRNTNVNSCHEDSELKIYALDVEGIAEQLTIKATNLIFNETASFNVAGNDSSGTILMCYARHGAIPLATLHDYSANISKSPLVLHSPKVGRWYIAIHLVNLSNKVGRVAETNTEVCYSLVWQVVQCPKEKAGLNCTWEKYTLQTVVRNNPSDPFESYYLPISGNASLDSAKFSLEPLLSNSSREGELDVSWTYFLLDIPYGASGGNLHVQLTLDEKTNYELYAKYGGLPSLDSWDYFNTNMTSISNGSMLFKTYDLGDRMVDFYILYARAGTWSFGLRQAKSHDDSASQNQTTMSISLERCPRKCSSPHGTCKTRLDESGLALFSYCSCDRDHGGFDCSIEIVSHKGHIWQTIALIASNAAALLPAYWSLRQKVFAECVLFVSSGISSGLYHACDVGTWCAFSFLALQFMDFWLSFMAVVSTFVYLADISEVPKRAMLTFAVIVTALLAVTEPTRPTNIVIVFAIGAAGLLTGWLIEFGTRHKSLSFPTEFRPNILDRWPDIKVWTRNLVKTLVERFRWGFVVAGFASLGLAVISWRLENTNNYWIWHSVWHVAIYTCSFLFLCSKAIGKDGESERPPDGNYELTRQDSFPRGE